MMMWGKSSSTRSCHKKKSKRLDVDHTPYSIRIPIASVFPTKHKWRESNKKTWEASHTLARGTSWHVLVTFSCPIFLWVFVHVFEVLWGSHCLGSKTSEISMKSDGTKARTHTPYPQLPGKIQVPSWATRCLKGSMGIVFPVVWGNKSQQKKHMNGIS